jgi:hypothetical protein
MSNNPLVTPPTVKRRLISMVYETLLGFAVLFLPFLIFEVAHPRQPYADGEHMRQALAFLVLGAYFIHQWSRDGQTAGDEDLAPEAGAPGPSAPVAADGRRALRR